MSQYFHTVKKIQNIFNKEDLDPLIEEIVANENFGKSETKIETYEQNNK